MSIKCHKCGEPLEPQMDKCPKCGSGDKDVMLGQSAKLLSMASAKVKAKGFHKFKLHVRHGGKVGKNGKIARETRRIDKETGRYIQRVEVQNEKGEWVVKHEEDEPLEQHRQKRPKQKS